MSLVRDLWRGEIAPIEGMPSSDDYFIATARRSEAQDELSGELSQEQTAKLDELMRLVLVEHEYEIVEAFRQGIKFGITLMEETRS